MIEIILFVSVIGLFALSALWSGSETAITSLSKYRIKKIIALKKPLASPLIQWLKAPYYLLTVILVGNTVTNQVLSSIATILTWRLWVQAHEWLHFSGVPVGMLRREAVETITWLGLTYSLIILGEVTPKIYGRCNPERFTMTVLPLLSWVLRLTAPIGVVVQRVVRWTLPSVTFSPVSKMVNLSVDEIQEVLSDARRTGVIEGDAGQMLERVLKLRDIDVQKVMIPLTAVDAVNIEQPENQVIDMIIETGRSRVPVYHHEKKNIAGFVHTKDLLWFSQNPDQYSVRDFIRPAYHIPADKKIYNVMQDLQSGKTHMAFVTDSFGGIIGAVTLEDVIEEIVGEILDEYDVRMMHGETAAGVVS